MAFVITQRCCKDSSCVPACPVDCIRPTPGQREFSTSEQLFIDPDACIECGACVEACPVGAIFLENDLPKPLSRYQDINSAYFERYPLESTFDEPDGSAPSPTGSETLRVAIVGAGPAACYAAAELLRHEHVEVEMFDRLPTPWGLVRSGVSPDHPETKSVTRMFARALRSDALKLRLNIDVGQDISHESLLEHHHAVIYAVGASSDRRLGVPGESMEGSHSATEFVAWYNGHPDYAERTFDLTGERCVIVGNGNVALDVARVLTLDQETLTTTDIADHALAALAESNVREVVIIGRRGPLQAAYSASEFLALGHQRGVDIIIDPTELKLDDHSRSIIEDSDVEPTVELKYRLANEYAATPATAENKRIVFRYLASPTEITGSGRVEAIELVRNELTETDGAVVAFPTAQTETLPATLVLRSAGYRGTPIPDVPFDDRRGVVPNAGGRVVSGSSTVTGVYVTGWIKRGPRGVIGSNRSDAVETVEALLTDFADGRLGSTPRDRAALDALLSEACPNMVDYDGWAAIDAAEIAAGKESGRSRVKLTTTSDLLRASRG